MEIFKYFGISLIILKAVATGLNFTFSKDKVLLGTTGKLTMRCDVTESDVETIYLIQIDRTKSTNVSGPNHDDWQRLALMHISVNENPTLDPAIRANDKNYVAHGTWYSLTPDYAYLTLSMDIEKLVCDDARHYRCGMSYRSSSSKTINVENLGTLSVYVMPKVISLTSRKNDMVVVHGSSSTDIEVVNVGDNLEFICIANVGSIPGTLIRWHITSETASTNEFIVYQPPQGTYDEGTATSDNQCGYTRVAIIRYKATAADANRENNLAFECYVTASGDPYGNSYISENNPRFYADVTDPGGSDTAAIVGGIVGGLVLIVIIVLLVYFLWYRPRSSGDDFSETKNGHQLRKAEDTELDDAVNKRQSQNDRYTAHRSEVESMNLSSEI